MSREPLVSAVSGVDENPQPEIKHFNTVALPGQMPNTFNINIIGLGADNKMYVWDSKSQKWEIAK